MTSTDNPVAVITGASRGLGLAFARELLDAGWQLIVDGRGIDLLDRFPCSAQVTALVAAAHAHGRVDALVNNASQLGPSPQPFLAEYPLNELRAVYEVNVIAP